MRRACSPPDVPARSRRPACGTARPGRPASRRRSSPPATPPAHARAATRTTSATRARGRRRRRCAHPHVRDRTPGRRRADRSRPRSASGHGDGRRRRQRPRWRNVPGGCRRRQHPDGDRAVHAHAEGNTASARTVPGDHVAPGLGDHRRDSDHPGARDRASTAADPVGTVPALVSVPASTTGPVSRQPVRAWPLRSERPRSSVGRACRCSSGVGEPRGTAGGGHVARRVGDSGPRASARSRLRNGDFSHRVRDALGGVFVAVDLSRRMAALTKGRGLVAQVADVEGLPFPDSQFDAVLANRVLYPSRSRPWSAGDREVLRPGGCLVAVTCSSDTSRARPASRPAADRFDLLGRGAPPVMERQFERVQRDDVVGAAVFRTAARCTASLRSSSIVGGCDLSLRI